jgi:hypothetical protein
MRLNVENYRKGLLIERVKYVRLGDDARLLLVDKELARLDGVLSTGSQAPLVEPVIIEREDRDIVKPKRTPKKLKGE